MDADLDGMIKDEKEVQLEGTLILYLILGIEMISKLNWQIPN